MDTKRETKLKGKEALAKRGKKRVVQYGCGRTEGTSAGQCLPVSTVQCGKKEWPTN